MSVAIKKKQEDSRVQKASGVDPEIKKVLKARLRRIEGQVQGLQRMVEAERYCPDILAQVAAARRALSGVSRELLRNHLKHCVTDAIRAGGKEGEETCDALAELLYRCSK